MYHQRSGPNAAKEKDYYTCSNYNTQHVSCTTHRVTTETIEMLVLETLRKVSGFAKDSEVDFRKAVTEMYSAKLDGDLKSRRKRLVFCEKRIGELDKLIKKLFEEHTLGNLADKRFDLLSAEYEQEQENLEREIEEFRADIDSYIDGTERANDFLELAQRYRDFTELNPQIINEFIDKIVVHERADKGCRITEQKIDIYLNFIGDFAAPKELEITDEARAAKRERQKTRKRLNGGSITATMLAAAKRTAANR
jgi:hypothetical protein